jgi:hypothetical protein
VAFLTIGDYAGIAGYPEGQETRKTRKQAMNGRGRESQLAHNSRSARRYRLASNYFPLYPKDDWARPARWLAERKLGTEQVPVHVADTLTPDEVRGYEGNRFFGTDAPVKCDVVSSRREAASICRTEDP